MQRPMCKVCERRPRAINYHRDGITHYRTRCESCIKRGKKQPPPKPRWQQGTYKIKMRCDLCGFKAKYVSQIVVYHVDGNLNHIEPSNLRSICKNCCEAVIRQDLPWRRGDLEPDF